MGTIAAAILAIAKAVPAADRLLAQVVDLYSSWKRQQNAQHEIDKNARNAALVRDAVGGLGMCCPTCGAPRVGAGQHGTTGEAPAVWPSGSVSS